MSFLGVLGECEREKVIERSHFLAYASHVGDEAAAQAFLASLRARHPLATHVCYGFVADMTGNIQRFSDDGEPQGTAGMPILGVIKAQKLFQTAVAVVRYFGGVKLGAGGLTRAYASSAAEVLEAADIRLFAPCTELCVSVSYQDADRALRAIGSRELLAREFDAEARFLVAVKDEERAAFEETLLGALSGRVRISERGRELRPFNIG